MGRQILADMRCSGKVDVSHLIASAGCLQWPGERWSPCFLKLEVTDLITCRIVAFSCSLPK